MTLTTDDTDDDAIVDLAVQQARRSPAGFMYVASRGTLTVPRHVQVMDDAIVDAVNRPEGRLILSVTVRAGKSTLGSRYTPDWFLGMNPDRNVILAGHEAGFAAEHSGVARDIMTEWGDAIFGVTVDPSTKARNRWKLAGHRGGMMALGVGGSPIGRGADLLIVDDPIKSLEQALSDEARRKINEVWWQGVMESRIEAGGTVIIICSRWHEDDLSGFLTKNYPADWTELRIPALCDDPDTDPLGRKVGQSFWPGRWPTPRLEERRDRVGALVWSAQYANRPTSPTGGMFPVGKLNPIRRPSDYDIEWGRGWDLAASDDKTADYTAGLLLGRYRLTGRWIIADLIHGQWLAHDRNERMKAAAARDGVHVRIELPQDPAAAGKEVAAQHVAMFSGHRVAANPVSGDKMLRAQGAASQVQAGNVDVLLATPDELRLIVSGQRPADPDGQAPLPDWYRPLVEELRAFPRGGNDDIVDAFSTVFNEMAPTEPEASGFVGIEAFEGMQRLG